MRALLLLLLTLACAAPTLPVPPPPPPSGPDWVALHLNVHWVDDGAVQFQVRGPVVLGFWLNGDGLALLDSVTARVVLLHPASAFLGMVRLDPSRLGEYTATVEAVTQRETYTMRDVAGYRIVWPHE